MSIRNLTVPFQGTNQQTPATLALWNGGAKRNGRAGGLRSAAKRRRTSTKAAAPRRRKSARRGKARLVKGSPAARRYMAKIRKMRKRR